jgi:(R)-2-hydroxyacyl-CoA dehydratese activating ATPase
LVTSPHSSQQSSDAASALGIDVGSATTKLVVLGASNAVLWHHVEATDPRIDVQSARLVDLGRATTGLAPAAPIVSTGYGRKLVEAATERLTEITCHARGAFVSFGRGGTLIDIGGQDSKVMAVGPSGKVERFQMNDKCSAGTGRFLEVAAARLGLSLVRLSEIALSAEAEATISSTCTVFAESEIVSRIARAEPVAAIARGLYRALSRRVAALARSIAPVPPFMLSGGVALSPAFRLLLAEELGVVLEVPAGPQLLGAYGAALLGLDRTVRATP